MKRARSWVVVSVVLMLLGGCAGRSSEPTSQNGAQATRGVVESIGTETTVADETADPGAGALEPSAAGPEPLDSPGAGVERVTWRQADNVTFAGYQTNGPADRTGYDISTDELTVGRDADGNREFALLRLPLGGDFFADEVTTARLFVKQTSGTAPTTLSVELVSDLWTPPNLTAADAQRLLQPGSATEAAVAVEADGWLSIDVTPQVKTWLSGAQQNFGIALLTDADNESFSFETGNLNEGQNVPYLEVSGQRGVRPTGYGKFSFTAFPEGGYPEDNDADLPDSNCLAYSLREAQPIYFETMGGSMDEVAAAYDESGEPGVLAYMDNLVEKYVATHKDELRISEFRALDSFDAPIDPLTEYRIALRVGARPVDDADGGPTFDGGEFDFHLWAQLDDGRWTQKFPGEVSEIIPGTVPGKSPEEYYWSSSRQWGVERFQNFYTSAVHYYAATKDVPGFTGSAE